MLAKEEEIEETKIDLYSEDRLGELSEEDVVSASDEAFMQGYLTAY